jgi:hypothetical protein
MDNLQDPLVLEKPKSRYKMLGWGSLGMNQARVPWSCARAYRKKSCCMDDGGNGINPINEQDENAGAMRKRKKKK